MGSPGKETETKQLHRSAAVLTGIAALLLSTKNPLHIYEIPIKYKKHPAVPGIFRARLFLCLFLPCGVASPRCRSPPSGMQERDFYLYIDGQPVQVSREVYREYYRAEDKERYFMGKLKKGHTKVNPETQEIQYIPSRELSYEQLAEQDWQFTASGDSVEDRVVRAAMMEKLQAVLHSLSAEELALLNELFYLEKTEREVAGLYAVSQNTIHYRKNRLLDKLRKMMEK